MKKKFVGLLVGVGMFLPMIGCAETKINDNFGCVDVGDDQLKCTVKISTDDNLDSFEVKLTTSGGATITAVDEVGTFTFTEIPDKTANPVIVKVSGPDKINDESVSLFTFTYKKSGEEDCKVRVSIGESKASTVDEPETPKQTGSAISYIAIATIGLGAIVLYTTNKNKQKMFNI